jgi:hypothetical protein
MARTLHDKMDSNVLTQVKFVVLEKHHFDNHIHYCSNILVYGRHSQKMRGRSIVVQDKRQRFYMRSCSRLSRPLFPTNTIAWHHSLLAQRNITPRAIPIDGHLNDNRRGSAPSK